MKMLAPEDPRWIGAYRLLARLGAGGMGDVYLARSSRGRTVAVKLVRAELAAQESFRERFRLEVNAARRVGGEWTAPVLDADTEAAVPWVATGYVAGPALSEVVAKGHGPLPERSVRILGAGLAHALRSIHGAGLVHRDLKPSNILITIDGPRVIDFGIARALEAVDQGITRTGAVVGSPGFMAPEQVRGLRVTPACDVFCLGSILMFAATGRLPFGDTENSHAVMFRIAEEEPDLTGLPADLAELVGDCLHKDPERRPSLDEILARTTGPAQEADAEPWLPGALVAQLGRHAVQLLEVEHGTGPQPKVSLPPEPYTPQQPSAPVRTTAVAPPPEPPPPAAAPRRPARRIAAYLALAFALLVVAPVVAGLLYAKFLADDGDDGTSDSGKDRAPSATGKPGDITRDDGNTVPAAYIGTWRAAYTSTGEHVRTMTIEDGATGEKVMKLAGAGPDYSCTWSATLKSVGTSLELGPTEVESGSPESCRPGQWSRLEMPDASTIVRELVGSGGTPLRYTKQ
ncbi:serine/threonine-protein kinase [Streptomyces qinzhouensis]|uniref:Serine/threonine protein kinase n=1 Tax=Streptomyces qinzhouensis TaxID=2599401 RepID=A0A5B8JJN6_9ACTN|nr:serine/threonine-protein kinase [Streptomyces qinzhouensis]QDY78060.1 serine/threonine protein kinase [Streptomyces qinzhouensis]